ncbi:UNVERIFIED_CONTAM: RNA polymerase sigma-70 factor (ECF subfamily) [Acetivibrio alkalicellulosi]
MKKESLRTDDLVSEMMNKYADMVYRLAYVMVRNNSDAEDIFQEVFIKLFQSQTPFNDKEHIKAWLIKTTTNHCKNLFKGYWYKNRISIDQVVIPVEDPEKKEIIQSVLGLPTKYREVIYLYYYMGFSTEELASILNTKASTIRTRLKRGRGLLKIDLENGGIDHE